VTTAEQARLEAELAALVRRAAAASPSRWTPARVAAARDLAGRLAALGREAGTGVPPGAVPGEVRAHGLADQVAVLGADLLAAAPTPDVIRRALADVRAAAAALGAARPPGGGARAPS